MSIGEDIKEVLEEIGSPFETLRDETLLSGEFLRYFENKQVTKPFIREFFLEAELAYDTQTIPGDVLSIPTHESKYIVMNKTPVELEGSVYKYSAVLHKSNVSGEILRPSGEADWPDATYHKEIAWQSIKTSAYALLTEALFGNEVEEVAYGNLSMHSNELYIPSKYGIKVQDRYVAVSGEHYEVTSVRRRRYPSVDVCTVREDVR